MPAKELLLGCLRDRLGLTGAKQSCEVQVCGVCTVLVDGNPVSSCCFLAGDIDGHQVETIEGLAGSDFTGARPRPSCGTRPSSAASAPPACCSPPRRWRTGACGGDRDQIAAAMGGNLCRCTGYGSVLDSLTEMLGGGAE